MRGQNFANDRHLQTSWVQPRLACVTHLTWMTVDMSVYVRMNFDSRFGGKIEPKIIE